ncbi:hypothetical protein QTP70_022566, partial [Hemibagrus guttatus]
RHDKGESANAVPHYQKLRSRDSRIWGIRKGQHSPSAMAEPRFGQTTSVIMVLPLPEAAKSPVEIPQSLAQVSKAEAGPPIRNTQIGIAAGSQPLAETFELRFPRQRHDKGESANAVPHYQKLCSRDSRIWGIRKGQHSPSAMAEPRFGQTTSVIMVLPLPDQVEALQEQLRGASIAAPRDPPTARSESPHLALPDKFDGSANRCRGFLRQCEVFFAHQPGMYGKEETQCAFVMSLLTDRALEWASVVWDADPQIRSSFSHFAGLIREVFEYPAGGKDISVQLMELRQGTDTAADYAITFCTLAAQSGWNDASLWAVFRAGLNPELQTELACRAEATTLSPFVWTISGANTKQRLHEPSPFAIAAKRITLASGRRRPNLCSWGDLD